MKVYDTDLIKYTQNISGKEYQAAIVITQRKIPDTNQTEWCLG